MVSESDAGKEALYIQGDGRIDMAYCVFDNDGAVGDVALLNGNGKKGKWIDVTLKNSVENKSGLRIEDNATLSMEKVRIKKNVS